MKQWFLLEIKKARRFLFEPFAFCGADRYFFELFFKGFTKPE